MKERRREGGKEGKKNQNGEQGVRVQGGKYRRIESQGIKAQGEQMMRG